MVENLTGCRARYGRPLVVVVAGEKLVIKLEVDGSCSREDNEKRRGWRKRSRRGSECLIVGQGRIETNRANLVQRRRQS